LEEVLAVVAAKRVPLAPELAGYLALEIAESPAAREGAVAPQHVYVAEEGSVAVVRSKREGDASDGEASIRAMLGKLLEVSGSVTPALSATARKRAGSGLPGLVEELEAALIPVNRAAGRRALARLAREVKRVTLGVGRNALRAGDPRVERRSDRPPSPSFAEDEAPTTAKRDVPDEVRRGASGGGAVPALQTQDVPKEVPKAPPSLSELPTVGIARTELEAAHRQAKRDSVDSLLDAFEVSEQRADKALSHELKQMAGLDPTPPPPDADAGLDALLEMTEGTPPAKETKAAPHPAQRPVTRREAKPQKAAAPAPRPSLSDERQLPTSPTRRRATAPSLTAELAKPKASRSFLGPAVALLVVAGAAALLLWMLKPGFFTGRTPEKIAEEAQEAERERQRIAAQAQQPQCKSTLVVRDVPADAEVLLRVGQAPTEVERMPVGARLEFVATAEGYAPKRTVVPQGATWDPGPDGKPRYEIAVQLDKSKKPGVLDPWPPAEPGSEVGGKGAPGTVRVVSTPKGAEVWLLVGLAPEARVELFRCDVDTDILVAGPKGKRSRLSVKPGDFSPDPQGSAGAKIASISAK
jgi:hypothetical protein